MKHVKSFESHSNKNDILLGDYLTISNYGGGPSKKYRCIGQGETPKFRNVIIVDGYEELTDDIIELTKSQIEKLVSVKDAYWELTNQK